MFLKMGIFMLFEMFRGMFLVTMLFKGLFFFLILGYYFLLLEKIILDPSESVFYSVLLLPDWKLSYLTSVKNRNSTYISLGFFSPPKSMRSFNTTGMIFFKFWKKKIGKKYSKERQVNSVLASNINRELSWLQVIFGPNVRKMCVTMRKNMQQIKFSYISVYQWC